MFPWHEGTFLGYISVVNDCVEVYVWAFKTYGPNDSLNIILHDGWVKG